MTCPLPSKTLLVRMQFILLPLVLTVHGFAQREPSLRNELKHMSSKTGVSVAMFDRGKLSTAPIRYPKDDWNEVDIPGAIGHSWSYEGLLSPDATLAAFPYWEVNPCPSMKNCDVKADRHFFLAIAHTDGSGVRKYPQIILPSEMCWTKDNSKVAMVAHLGNDSQPQLLVVALDSGKADPVADGKNVAVTPQCWSPDGKQLVYFAGENDFDRPGTILIFNTVTRESRELLYDNTNCKKDSFCVSPYPTWSPDGEWIAYFQGKRYWAVHPNGQGRKGLFRRGGALSPLQWSPDGRYVLYADCCALRDTLRCMCEIGRIHVRRLADNADVKISGDGYQDMYIPRWTWIHKKWAN